MVISHVQDLLLLMVRLQNIKDNLIQPILQGCHDIEFFMSYVMDNMSRHVICHDITYNLV